MESNISYQPKYIWKETAEDGLLPVVNFTDEIKEDDIRKKMSKESTNQKELG
jgi:hypothetical protein